MSCDGLDGAHRDPGAQRSDSNRGSHIDKYVWGCLQAETKFYRKILGLVRSLSFYDVVVVMVLVVGEISPDRRYLRVTRRCDSRLGLHTV